MKSVLHIAWFVLAGLILIGNLGAAQYVWLQEVARAMALGRAPLIISTMLMSVAFGVAYLLVAKTARLSVPLVFGWLQLIAYAIAHAAGIWAFYLQYELMTNRDSVDLSTFGMVNAVQMSFFAISALFFLAAMLSAVLTLGPSPNASDFD